VFESRAHDRWAVWVSGFFFAGSEFCKTIPKRFHPIVSQTRLVRSADDAEPEEAHTGAVALLRGGTSLVNWFFAGESPRVPLRLPVYANSSQVSALISCSTGASVVVNRNLSKRDLAEFFRDTTRSGALTLTDFAPASNPVTSSRSLTGSAGTVRVSLSNDPRTQEGIGIAGTEHTKTRGRVALVSRASGTVSVSWIEVPNLLVTVESANVDLAELVRISNGLSGLA
jgi:hypothetical protein